MSHTQISGSQCWRMKAPQHCAPLQSLQWLPNLLQGDHCPLACQWLQHRAEHLYNREQGETLVNKCSWWKRNESTTDLCTMILKHPKVLASPSKANLHFIRDTQTTCLTNIPTYICTPLRGLKHSNQCTRVEHRHNNWSTYLCTVHLHITFSTNHELHYHLPPLSWLTCTQPGGSL